MPNATKCGFTTTGFVNSIVYQHASLTQIGLVGIRGGRTCFKRLQLIKIPLRILLNKTNMHPQGY